ATPALPRRSASHEVLTRTGAVLGTPAYMSPEQVLGTTVDARSDQFSFAVTAWEALVGSRPFQGETLAELANAITSGLSEAPAVAVGVPRFVVPALRRALATVSEDRFESMEVLTDILSRDPAARRNMWMRAAGAVTVADGLGAVTWATIEPAQCSGAGEQLARVWNDASRTRMTEALLATGVGHAGVTADKVDHVIMQWGQHWVAAHTEACEATRVRREQSETILDLRMACLDQRIAELDALLTMLADADADVATRATEAASHLPTVAACADRTALTRTVDPPRDDATRDKIAEVRRKLAQASAAEKLGRYRDAADLAEHAQLAATALGYRPLIAEAAETRGRVLAMLGETEQAIQQLRDAALHARASGHIEVAANAETRLTYVVGFSAGRRDEGLAWGLQAQAEIDRLGGDRPVSAELLSHRAVLLQGAGDSAGALTAFSAALKARERLLGPEHPDTAESRFNLGVLHLRLGQYQRARQQHERALQIRTNVFGPEHPWVADSLMELGSVAMRTVRFADAATLYTSALTLRRAAFGEDHVPTARAHENLANAAARTQLFESARTHYAAALAVYERRLNEDDPRLGRLWMNLGTMELLAGRVDAACIELKRAAAHFERVSGPQHPEFGWAMASLGRAYHRGGDSAKALQTLVRASSILQASAAEPLVRGTVQFDLAKVLIESDPERAAEAAAAADPLLVAAGAVGEFTLGELRTWQRETLGRP
ncbi:MAG: tetratricopeptide repeat protein, partial [Nannocystaceae bacterium]|nr:tetratricopeptide repeat protein [Nannocystaceae bacterium]